jgi:hypothetical protein
VLEGELTLNALDVRRHKIVDSIQWAKLDPGIRDKA